MRAYLSPTDNSTKFNEIWASRIQEHAEDKRKSWIVQGVPAYYGKNNVRKDFVCCMLIQMCTWCPKTNILKDIWTPCIQD